MVRARSTSAVSIRTDSDVFPGSRFAIPSLHPEISVPRKRRLTGVPGNTGMIGIPNMHVMAT